MYNTSFNLSTLNIDNVAKPYYYHQGEYYQIDELSFLWGDITPPQPYWKMRAFPAGGLYTTISDLSHFLIAHMNDGVYQNIRILEKQTVELMHNIQPDNNIGYGLAWMDCPIGLRYSANGHGGDLPGADTWMLYMPSEDIGVIYFANGNPAYLQTPIIGFITIHLLLYSLFKEGGATMRHSLDIINYHPFSFMSINIFYYSKQRVAG
jgi:CubicO group peptidase (beta-lactamase class C family)